MPMLMFTCKPDKFPRSRNGYPSIGKAKRGKADFCCSNILNPLIKINIITILKP